MPAGEKMSDALSKMLIARHKDRPTFKDLVPMIFDDFFELHGDRLFGDDAAICGGIALLDGRPVTVIGHVKGKNVRENIQCNFGMPHPEGYRKALRLMKQAEKFSRPVICFIDTPGAYCGVGAEERGQGEAIARNLIEMMGLEIPVVALIWGEGGSGGALALGVANRVLMMENAVYSVISPKGFASIIWKDASRENDAAELLKMTAQDLLRFGVIDAIVPEAEGGAHKDPRAAAAAVKAALKDSLDQLEQIEGYSLHRYDKYRKMGVYSEE